MGHSFRQLTTPRGKWYGIVPNAKRFIVVVSFAVVAFPVSATADITCSILFIAGAPTGTMTWSAVGDPEPTGYTITDGFSEWSPPDFVVTNWDTGWSAGEPVKFGAVAGLIQTAVDDIVPNGTGLTISFTSSNVWSINAPADLGIYGFSDCIDDSLPAVPALDTIAIFVLGCVLAVGGYRRLRA